jgi:hypothetical protein
MVAPSTSSNSAASVFLRFYGIACVGIGLGSLWLAFAVKPGTHGIADWTRPWPEFTIFVLLGVAVFLLLRWLTLAFTILSCAFGLFYTFGSLARVPFPFELFNIFFALLAILPCYLTYRAWRFLR